MSDVMLATMQTHPSDRVTYDQAHEFTVLSKIAHMSSKTADLSRLLSGTLRTCLEQLSLSGALVWLRSHKQDIFSPSGSRLPDSAVASAFDANNDVVRRLLETGYLLLDGSEAQSLVLLPEGMAIALAPIQSEDMVMGILGYIAQRGILEPLRDLLKASADLLSASLVSAWLRRQQAETEEVSATLFQFASELRAQRKLDAILQTLNTMALRVFNCDWSAVYTWQDLQFVPVQIMTRIGEQPVDEEPVLKTQDNHLLEIIVSDPQLLFFYDLREQPKAMPIYFERHGLRGLVLVPLQQVPWSPQGLLTLGYRRPLADFSGRYTTLAQGLARMVVIALEREGARQREHSGI